ncbi:MAG: carbon-nitrogen family hydrolase [Desulfobacterales bacterium]|nr:carbon-nitrogen family hydrolase [Desulfobacterales bacterium]
MKESLVAGLVQFDVMEGSVESNLTRVFQGMLKLAESGAHLVVLPEMWSGGFDYDHLAELAQKTPDIVERLRAFAVRERLVIAGSLPEAVSGGVANTLFVVDADGRLAGSYRKIHLFSPTGEDAYFMAGKKNEVISTSVGNIGPMICYDLRFPELARSLAVKGAEILICPAQWPQAREGHWEALLKARAIENQCFVIGCNRVGRSGGLIFSGASQMVSPLGEVCGHAGSSDGELLTEIFRGTMDEFRSAVPCLEERRPMCYS